MSNLLFDDKKYLLNELIGSMKPTIYLNFIEKSNVMQNVLLIYNGL